MTFGAAGTETKPVSSSNDPVPVLEPRLKTPDRLDTAKELDCHRGRCQLPCPTRFLKCSLCDSSMKIVSPPCMPSTLNPKPSSLNPISLKLGFTNVRSRGKRGRSDGGAYLGYNRFRACTFYARVASTCFTSVLFQSRGGSFRK